MPIVLEQLEAALEAAHALKDRNETFLSQEETAKLSEAQGSTPRSVE